MHLQTRLKTNVLVEIMVADLKYTHMGSVLRFETELWYRLMYSLGFLSHLAAHTKLQFVFKCNDLFFGGKIYTNYMMHGLFYIYFAVFTIFF